MIWTLGAIVPDDGLAVSALDRAFEHGLGLFETLRTWDGRPTLLDRHRARILRSAAELGIPIDPGTLPDPDDVRALLGAEGAVDDRMLRITASGGTASAPSVVWMRSAPLPTPTPEAGAVVCLDSVDAAESDPTARHKTLNYWSRRLAFERARAMGADEALISSGPRGVVEGSRSSLFLVEGEELVTPSLDAPIVPGIMRGLVLEVAGGLPLAVREVAVLGLDRIGSASEIFLTNAVRGIIPVARVDTPSGPIDRPAPGPWTLRLRGGILGRIRADLGGDWR